MKRRRKAALPEAGINITSLLDITFVLLIAFMVVAPSVRYNVELELPKVGDGKAESPEKAKKAVAIQVKASDSGEAQIYVNGSPKELNEILEAVQEARGAFEPAPVSLEADRRVPWNEVAAIINELRNGNIENLGIVTEKVANQ
jgi:biopolymer transport protein ExbD